MEGYRKECYCEFAFLKKFMMANGHISSFESNDALRLRLDVEMFLTKSDLQIDVLIKEFEEQVSKNDSIFRLWKRAANGECTISFVEEHGFKSKKEKLRRPEGLKSVYLIEAANNEADSYRKKYGVVVITPESWESNKKAKEISYLFRDCGCGNDMIKKDQKCEWRDLLRSEEYRLCDCNSMIIMDNYLLKDIKIIKNNLYPILEELLPKEQLSDNIDFHLTIISYNQYNNIEYDKVIEEIKNIRPDLRLRIELYIARVEKKFHDRIIVTNNTWISCAGGFDLIGSYNNLGKTSTLNILYPGIQSCNDTVNNSYIPLLNFVKDKIVEKVKTKTGNFERYPKNEAGEEWTNRLISGI